MTKQAFPPSLSRLRDVGAPNETEEERQRRDHMNARLERKEEQERKVRRAAVEAAMRKLPLRPGAENLIPGMIGVFEQAHHAAVNKIENKPATARTIESELKVLTKNLKKVADHFDDMHGETVRIWAAGADAAINGAALILLLRTAEEWAQASVDTLKRAKRIEERGRTKDFKAEGLRAAAAWVYERLTTRKANTAFDAYAGQELGTPFVTFLEGIHGAYGITASARSRARKRKPIAKKRGNSF
jgi:hypothetical protein